MDWTHWTPQVRAVLCFILRGEEVLLIHKKRGLGAGLVNAPGGKLEPGETTAQAAVRETEEEIGVTPNALEQRGELHFQFTDGLALHCTVYVAREFTGTPHETDEATPFWVPISQVPYHEMWEDDRHWLPQVLQGQSFLGYFEFDGATMLSKRVEWITPAAL